MMLISNCLTTIQRRPVIIVPFLILVNVLFIHLYGIPIFDQTEGADYRVKVFVATRENNDNTFQKGRQRNFERLQNISTICEKYNQDENFRKLGMSGIAYGTSDKHLFYCSVPKIGCTYWKRVIRYIGDDYKGHFKSPESLPRLFVHEGPFRNTTVIQLSNVSVTDSLDYKFKFMFTRDPYERLWSGYLDKLYLPDFWWWLGINIVNVTRPRADARSLKCGDDVTFEEFLTYMVENLKSGVRVDNHFAPIYTQCNPCVIKFNLVGKLETFDDDSSLVLQENIVTAGASDETNKKDLVLEEVQTLLRYNFEVLDKLIAASGNPDCYNPLSIANRLWKTFQYHGYISDRHTFPSTMTNYLNDLTILRKALLKQIIYIRQSAGSDTDNWKQQRQNYLNTAYKSVSQKVLRAIEITNKGDFELFGYTKRTFQDTES